jgi:hypothetical protein
MKFTAALSLAIIGSVTAFAPISKPEISSEFCVHGWPLFCVGDLQIIQITHFFSLQRETDNQVRL